MIIKMKREEETTDRTKVKEVRNQAVDALVEYLDTFYPEDRSSDSKHALMGPVGKLLTRVTSTGEIQWGAVKGYVLNIHKNQQSPRGVSAEAAEKLDGAIGALEELKSLLPPTKWLKTVEDLDDEVFFRVYKTKLVGQREWIHGKFRDWLVKSYSSIDELNEILEPDEKRYDSFDDVEDPFSTPGSLKKVVDNFWTNYKRRKED
ncbi:MAG: hypothetical protein ACFFFC_15470 [Candidatus Thorarchaeota archaeon]